MKLAFKKEILIHEQNPVNRKLVSKLVRKAGCQVREVVTSAELFQELKKTPAIQALVINHEAISIHDQQTTDNTFIQKVKEICPTLKILVISSSDKPDVIMSIYKNGYSAFLSKPLQGKLFQKSLHDLMCGQVDFIELCKHLTLFDNFPQPIYLVKATSEILYANRECINLFKLHPRVIQKRPLCCNTFHFDACQKGSCIHQKPIQNKKTYKIRELNALHHGDHLNLYASLIPLYSGESPVAVLVTLTDLSSEASLQDNFRDLYEKEKFKSEKLTRVSAELERMNQTLEHQVQERTVELSKSRKEIKEVLDHIDLAICTIDLEGHLSEGYSMACNELFNKNLQQLTHIDEVLEFDKTPGLHEDFHNWLKMCTTAYENMPWKDIEQLSPLYGDWKFGQKILYSRWNAVIDNGKLNRLMMISRDVTDKRSLESQIKKEREDREREMSLLTNLLSFSDEDLNAFLKEINQNMIVLEKQVSMEAQKLDMNLLWRTTHSIKGGSGLMNFQGISDISHLLEDELEKLKTLPSQDSAQNVLSTVRKISLELRQSIDHVMSWAKKLGLLKPDNSYERQIKIHESELERLLFTLRTIQQGQMQDNHLDNEINFWKRKSFVSCKKYFHKLVKFAQKLSSEYNKDIHFILKGENTKIHPSYAAVWVDPLTHLLRNAIDHGIETDAERKTSQKNKCACILLEFKLTQSEFSIVLEDDGRGIDGEKVYQAYQKMGMPLATPLTAKDKQSLIFQPGLSTREETTNLSGRGVGMDIVKSMIESLQGKLEFDSTPGKGTRFFITAPYKDPFLK